MGAAGGVAGWRLITQGGVPPVMVVVMLPVADDHMALAALSERSSLSAQSPLGAILPVEQTIRRWRVGTGQHAS